MISGKSARICIFHSPHFASGIGLSSHKCQLQGYFEWSHEASICFPFALGHSRKHPFSPHFLFNYLTRLPLFTKYAGLCGSPECTKLCGLFGRTPAWNEHSRNSEIVSFRSFDHQMMFRLQENIYVFEKAVYETVEESLYMTIFNVIKLSQILYIEVLTIIR